MKMRLCYQLVVITEEEGSTFDKYIRVLHNQVVLIDPTILKQALGLGYII